MSSELEEWEEALPEGEETVEISFHSKINENRQLIWRVSIQGTFDGNKYYKNVKINPNTLPTLEDSVDVQMDVVISQIESTIHSTMREYILKEMIENE